MMICYTYTLWKDSAHQVNSHIHHLTSFPPFFLVRTVKFSLSKFQLYNTVLSIRVTMLHISFSDLIQRIFVPITVPSISLFVYLKIIMMICSWCGLVDWMPACESKGRRFDFQSRAHAWVAGQVPSEGCARGNHTLMFLSLFSLPSPL